MTYHDVGGWVAAYEQAWREDDVGAVDRLFTEDAHYLVSPYADPLVGHEAIRGFWLDDQGREFRLTAEPVALEGATAVVRLQVDYASPEQQYRDLWVLRFADDGRVEHFEEWAYWPGRDPVADGD